MSIDNKKLLERFFEYIAIDSETGNENAMCERVTADLKATGCEVWRDNAGEKIDSNGFNVYAKLDGDPSISPLLFSAHLDTVKPGNGIVPVIEDGVIKSSGDTILGSDDKSGVAGIIEAIATVARENIPHRPIEVFFSICEEGGLRGSKNADFSRFKSAEAVVLDSGGNVGRVITSAPGQVKIKATVTGKSAHAGVAPETGISAIQAAAAGVAEMKLLRIDEETTANIATFVSQYADNIVPEKVYLQGEARSRDTDKLKAQADDMRACLQRGCDKFKAALECSVETSYFSYKIEENDPLVQKVKAACESIGAHYMTEAGGGGSDANIMNLSGIKSVVLGTGMDKVHTTSEQITVENLEKTAELCLALIKG